MKNARLALICGGLLLALGFVLLNHKSEPAGKCGAYRQDKIISFGSTKINAEVAQSQSALAKGLGDRPCIEPNQAMLFHFSKPGQYAIWMKNMKFPIDILWISPDQKVVGIERNVEPSTYPDSFANKDKAALYVLELKANRSKELNINLGSSVRLQ